MMSKTYVMEYLGTKKKNTLFSLSIVLKFICEIVWRKVSLKKFIKYV